MNQPLQLSFRDCEESADIVESIHKHAARLDRFSPDIIGCSVLVEKPHRHHQKGALYHIRINLTVPGQEIVVQRDPAEHVEHADIFAAIRDAFDAAKRQLEDYTRERRRDVKQHGPSLKEIGAN